MSAQSMIISMGGHIFGYNMRDEKNVQRKKTSGLGLEVFFVLVHM